MRVHHMLVYQTPTLSKVMRLSGLNHTHVPWIMSERSSLLSHDKANMVLQMGIIRCLTSAYT